MIHLVHTNHPDSKILFTEEKNKHAECQIIGTDFFFFPQSISPISIGLPVDGDLVVFTLTKEGWLDVTRTIDDGVFTRISTQDAIDIVAS